MFPDDFRLILHLINGFEVTPLQQNSLNMCGRYLLVQKAEVIERTFNIRIPERVMYKESFNITPGAMGLVITAERPREAQQFIFGLTPYWAQKPMYLINARAEGDHNKENDALYNGARGIISKPAFRLPIRRQRCLVIADAFIEGTTQEKLAKPFLVYVRDRKPFAMAGIWDSWNNPSTGEQMQTFAIITTSANALMQMIPHHRSPVILEKSMEETWLHGKHLDDITWMLKPYPAEKMNAYPISPAIRNPLAAGRQLIDPIGERLITETKIETRESLRLQGMGYHKVRPANGSTSDGSQDGET
jgi:putative SOS response-associated peptidase YedK